MRAICAGTMTKNDVVQASIHQYRNVFARTTANLGLLKNVSVAREARRRARVAQSGRRKHSGTSMRG